MSTMIFKTLDGLIGVLPVSDAFIGLVDGALSLTTNIIATSSWLIPMNVLTICLGVVFAIENFHNAVGVTKWVIELIRG